MDLEDLERHIEQAMNEYNNQSILDFEGYSPFDMHQILYSTFGKSSPLQLQKLPDTDYKKIPILNQIKYLADLIDKNGEIKLTSKGFLPTKIVSELYEQRFLKDKNIDSGISKLYKETDSITINLTRILIELAGLAKKRSGKLSLTKTSKKILSDNHVLLEKLLLTFTTKFNWAYYDRYGDNQIGQFGYGFSLILLSKYGHENQLETFYAEKYFKAFPQLFDSIEPSFGTREEYAANCYSIRTFRRFLDYFGLVNINEQGLGVDRKRYVEKTNLFDGLIKCTPHNI